MALEELSFQKKKKKKKKKEKKKKVLVLEFKTWQLNEIVNDHKAHNICRQLRGQVNK